MPPLSCESLCYSTPFFSLKYPYFTSTQANAHHHVPYLMVLASCLLRPWSLVFWINSSSAQQEKDIRPHEPGGPTPQESIKRWMSWNVYWRGPLLIIRNLLLCLLYGGVLFTWWYSSSPHWDHPISFLCLSLPLLPLTVSVALMFSNASLLMLWPKNNVCLSNSCVQW